jgi:dihydrofolate reductase
MIGIRLKATVRQQTFVHYLSKMQIIQIMAVNPTRQGLGIGYKGGLPWHVPEDLKHFKAVTEGHPVLMGRKTYESLPFKRGLPNRLNLILSRGFDVEQDESVVVGDSMEGLIHYAKDLGYEKVFIIGGAEIYNLSLPYTDQLIVTIVKGDYELDTYLPEEYLKNTEMLFSGTSESKKLPSGERVVVMERVRGEDLC